jgi:hypothetical protein
MSAHLSEEARLRLVHQLVAALGTLFAVLDTDREEEHERLEQIWRLAQRAENLLGSLQSERPGRGNCPDDRLPTLSKPKSDMYSINVKLPEVFQSLVRYTPAEFEDLHNDVLDVLMLARNHAHTFTDEENKLRRKTRFRYSSRERLFHFLGVTGIQGNENDSGAYQQTKVYRNPELYLLPHHTGLFDGIFQCPLHINASEAGVLPAGAVELKAAPAPMRMKLKRMNKRQRYLRCPIEQTFGHIKGWGIVGESIFRGDLDQQGENFLLCMQLSARMMRVRGLYPRGDRWLRGEMEDWEREYEEAGWLYSDPMCPDLYV